MWALVAAIGEFKEKEISKSIVKEEISRKKKQWVLFKLSPQVVYGTIVLMITNILVIQFLIPLSFCVLCFFDPPLGEFFLPYIVTEIVSLPST